MSGVTFDDSYIIGSEIEDITAVSVDFINTQFVGSTVDTKNFAKVRFLTEADTTEGNPIITPHYAKFEQSTLVSRRSPPETGVIDLSLPGDDVVFEDVLFVDTRIEGWFDPARFRKSNFVRCQLQDSLSAASLRASGNALD